MHRVLIVDDDSDIRTLMSQLLSGSGCEVILSEGGREALELLRSSTHIPDVVVLDVQMPGFDGWDTLAELRSDANLASLAVLLCTVKGGAIDKERGWRLGCDGYLTKPFDVGEFVEVVGKLMSSTPAERRALRQVMLDADDQIG